MADISTHVTLAVTYRVTNPATGCRGSVEVPSQLEAAPNAPVDPLVIDFHHRGAACTCLCGSETELAPSSPKLQHIHDHVQAICEDKEAAGHEPYDADVSLVVFLKLALGLPVPEAFQLQDENVVRCL